jgi:ketosteroid isomerase-like protein
MRSQSSLKSATTLSSAEYIADRVKSAFEALETDDLRILESLYTEDVHFEDPAHALQGRKTVMSHFASLFKNLDSCSFKFHQTLISEPDIFMSWTMFVVHPKLQKGEIIRVEGGSLLKTRHGKIFYHRDYFDMGAMLYEQLPVLGVIIQQLKQRLGQ